MAKRLSFSAFWNEAFIEFAASGEFDCCIPWEWGTNSDSYPSINLDGKMKRVNRVVCEMAHGPAPKGKPYALHKCGNPSCINANHLYWGDQSDNYADAILHNTAARGENHGRSKLTNDEVCEILSAYSSGEFKQAQIADAYGVHTKTIWRVVARETYATVNCEAD